MRTGGLRHALCRLYARRRTHALAGCARTVQLTGDPVDPNASRAALEADLVARYRLRYPHERRWLNLLNPWTGLARFAAVGLVVLVLGAGACTTETTTEVALGQRLQVGLKVDGDPARFAGGEALVDWVRARPGTEEANVNAEMDLENEQPLVALDVLVWNVDLDGAQLVADLRAAFPALVVAGVTVTNLNTTITESWADRLGRTIFRIETGGGEPEEMRRRILEQFAAQGIPGEVQVDVRGDGDRPAIKVILTEEGQE